jgi:hypothetical protein
MGKLISIFLVSCLMTLFQNVFAHVTLLYPVGGEIFQAGEVVKLQWYEAINHGPGDWDLYFSNDGGSTWQPIAINVAQSQLEYDWTVPNSATDSGQIKVIQDNATGMDYADACGNFTINVSTGIKESKSYAESFVLYPAYPNPFNPTTTIEFSLPQSVFVTLKIYNILGEEVATLLSEKLASGNHTYDWNAGSLASGVYLYRIQAGDYMEAKKMILMR